MSSLQYSGLGGKRSSGFGRFELDIQNIPLELSDRLTKNHSDKVMSLTTALPVDADLEEAMEDGHYLLTKSSGFAFIVSRIFTNLLLVQLLVKHLKVRLLM